MKINTTEENGIKGINGLIELTQEKKKTKYEIIQEEILKEVFGEWKKNIKKYTLWF